MDYYYLLFLSKCSMSAHKQVGIGLVKALKVLFQNFQMFCQVSSQWLIWSTLLLFEFKLALIKFPYIQMWMAIMHPIYYMNPNFLIEIQKWKSFLIQFWMLHKLADRCVQNAYFKLLYFFLCVLLYLTAMIWDYII